VKAKAKDDWDRAFERVVDELNNPPAQEVVPTEPLPANW
jgi:hypothetical protein